MIEKHWQDLIKPNEIEIQSEGTVTRLTVEPLERGFGFTLGAALRRILLSCLEGVAVTAVRIDGVRADSAAIPGVREDLTDILLNIKEIALRSGNGIDRSRMAIRKRGPAIVTAGDIQADGDVEIVEPDHVICTLDTDVEFSMEFAVGAGTGYVAADRHHPDAIPSGFIPIDCLYSPVKKVSYTVATTRQGHVLDYDRLVMTIETDGSISGDDAAATAARIFREQLAVFINFDEPQPEVAAQKANEFAINPALLRRVDEFELSVRSTNCLRGDNIVYIGDLVMRTEAQMLRTPNFGRKSLNEIKGLLAAMGLNLGMQMPEWPPDDLEDLVRKYADKDAHAPIG